MFAYRRKTFCSSDVNFRFFSPKNILSADRKHYIPNIEKYASTSEIFFEISLFLKRKNTFSISRNNI